MNAVREMGALVRFHRKKAGLTQKQLADFARVGKTVVFDIEKGKTTVRLDTLAKVLSVLNISLEVSSPLMPAFTDADAKERKP